MYSSLAKYYDALMSDVDYARWLRLVAGFLNSEIKGGGKNIKGADLACGTGTFSIGLKRLGFDVYGVDNSPLMLEAADTKAKQAGLSIPFINQDINRFVTNSPLDFITCMCDGVNYLKNPQKLFSCANAALKKNGVFIFDISTEYKLMNVLAGNTFSGEENGVTYIWQNVLGAKKDRILMQLSFFEDCGGHYIRSDESQVQYIHKADILVQLLKHDFDVKIYGEKSAKLPKPDEKRIHFVAVKK